MVLNIPHKTNSGRGSVVLKYNKNGIAGCQFNRNCLSYRNEIAKYEL